MAGAAPLGGVCRFGELAMSRVCVRLVCGVMSIAPLLLAGAKCHAEGLGAPLLPVTKDCTRKPVVLETRSMPALVAGEPHLRLLARTDRETASIEAALLLEFSGHRASGYAWMIMWSDSGGYHGPLGCNPHRLIRTMALLPSRNVLDQQRIELDIGKVRASCAAEKAGDRERCGTIDEVLNAFAGSGMRILLQGREIANFEDGAMQEAGYITVLGREGLSSRMVELITYPGGAAGKGHTRVLSETEPR